MAERKELSKKIRFEVFKRDSFKCQYCGRSAPDVILEVDHIIPVAKGGDNDIMNLITSCRDCNRGKRDKMLSDDSLLKKQKAQLDEINEKREQMEMMVEWRESLRDLLEEQTDAIENLFSVTTDRFFTDLGRIKMKKIIKRFGFHEAYLATEMSLDKYYTGDTSSLENTFDKIGGICYNRWRQKQEYGD